jgi:hypothetical protein
VEEQAVNRTIVVRAALLYGAYVNASVGVWATIAPRSWYDSFPGLGRVWVATDGPYNEHLVRDVGALGIGLTIVLLAAAWLMTRELVLTAGIAMTVAAIPHTLYHLRHMDLYDSASDKLASVGGLVLGTLLGVAVLVYAPKRAASPASPPL